MAGRRPLLQFSRAAIVAVEATLAGILDEGRPAVPAASDAGEQRGTVDDTRRNSLRIAALEKRLDGGEGRLVDNDRHLQLHPLGEWARLPATAVAAIEVVICPN